MLTLLQRSSQQTKTTAAFVHPLRYSIPEDTNNARTDYEEAIKEAKKAGLLPPES